MKINRVITVIFVLLSQLTLSQNLDNSNPNKTDFTATKLAGFKFRNKLF